MIDYITHTINDGSAELPRSGQIDESMALMWLVNGTFHYARVNDGRVLISAAQPRLLVTQMIAGGWMQNHIYKWQNELEGGCLLEAAMLWALHHEECCEPQALKHLKRRFRS